ncbi:hypothetical protein J4E80_003145 [Alternaria sp. BMP 0032]|nr:hypothetical protein J4E80_003145 [Alternaria sp. BMP 0032]
MRGSSSIMVLSALSLSDHRSVPDFVAIKYNPCRRSSLFINYVRGIQSLTRSNTSGTANIKFVQCHYSELNIHIPIAIGLSNRRLAGFVVTLTSASASASVDQPTSISTSDSDEPSSSATDSASTILSTVTVTSSTPSPPSNTDTAFPTAPPFSYNPSASRGSASPISRPTPEPSSALVAGSTLSTATTPSSTSTRISQYTGVPPAPPAATGGASGMLSDRSKERVWWVAFFVPLLLLG